MKKPYEIIPAQLEDVETIGKLRAKSWLEEYGSLPGVTEPWINSQVARIMSDASNQQRADAIAESLRPHAHSLWRVARLALDHTIIGFLDARKLDDGSQELHSLHIAKEYQSQGIGQAMMNEAHAWFDPSQSVFLDVVRDNHRAQAFYMREPNDYQPTGYTYDFEQLRMMRMQRDARS